MNIHKLLIISLLFISLRCDLQVYQCIICNKNFYFQPTIDKVDSITCTNDLSVGDSCIAEIKLVYTKKFITNSEIKGYTDVTQIDFAQNSINQKFQAESGFLIFDGKVKVQTDAVFKI